jgi:hypothetical protein
MFTVDTWATITIYIEYIIPAVILLLILLTYLIKYALYKVKIARIHYIHKNIEWKYHSTYWEYGYCTICGKNVLQKPTSSNTSMTHKFYETSDSFTECTLKDNK